MGALKKSLKLNIFSNECLTPPTVVITHESKLLKTPHYKSMRVQKFAIIGLLLY